MKAFTEALIRVLDNYEANPEELESSNADLIADLPKRVDLNVDLFKSSLSFKSKPYVFKAFHNLPAIKDIYELYKPVIKIFPINYENRFIERELNYLINPEEIELLKALKHKYDPHNILNPGVFSA